MFIEQRNLKYSQAPAGRHVDLWSSSCFDWHGYNSDAPLGLCVFFDSRSQMIFSISV